MSKLTIRDIDVANKEVIMRVDFNVPMKDGVITDNTRIAAAVPSIKYLLEKGAKLVLCSHLGRPKAQVDLKYTLQACSAELAKLLGKDVQFAADCIGEASLAQRAALQAGEVVLLENVRFYEGEEKNDPAFAQQLAGKAEIFVNDAFGTAHRAHASTEGLSKFVKQSAMGFLIERELEFLQGKLDQPQRPFLVIMGGAKVSDKIQVISKLMEKADAFIIGGAMANTFLKAQGYDVGASKVEGDKLELANSLLELAKQKGVAFHLPCDLRTTTEFKDGAATSCTAKFSEGGKVAADAMGIDIGDASIEEFKSIIMQSKTVLWNGPMGVFEMECFAKGTRDVAQAIADSGAISIIGGGDSVTAANKFGFAEKFSFLSTGGGASLELLEGLELPGIGCLNAK